MRLGFVYYYLCVPVLCSRGRGGYQGFFARRGRFFDRKRHENYRPTTFKPKVYDVDEILYGLLSQPSSSTGEVIFHYLTVFERMITEISEGFKSHNYKYYEIANILYARGLPKFLTITYNQEMLMASYSWSIVDFAKFSNQVKTIFKLWKSFENSFQKIKQSLISSGRWNVTLEYEDTDLSETTRCTVVRPVHEIHSKVHQRTAAGTELPLV